MDEQNRGGGSYAQALRRKPAADFPTNEMLVGRMSASAPNAACFLRFRLLQELTPLQVGNAIAAAGVEMPRILAMFAVGDGIIKVQFCTAEATEHCKCQYGNNVGNTQGKLQLLSSVKTRYISVSRVPGDVSDEQVKLLLFGENQPRVHSVHHERYRNEQGDLL